MAGKPFILFLSDDACRIGTTSSGSPSTHDVAAGVPSIAAALKQLGHGGSSILLAIPSHWCFAATMPASDDLPRHDRRALLYRLEEQLPIAAEQLVADFMPMSDGGLLGLAARADLIRPWVESLEQSGISVASIAPTALLAAQHLAASQSSSTLLLETQSQQLLDQITLQDGRLTAWTLVPAADDFNPTDATQAAITTAAHILAGRTTPLAEFRRDALAPRDRMGRHRRALDALLACAAVLLLAVAGSFLVRAHRYDDRARSLESTLSSQFSAAFPQWSVPPDVRAVLASEHRKLLAQTSTSAAGMAGGSALTTLHATLKSLPPDLRLHLTRIDVTDASIEMDGRVRSLESLDTLSKSLRAAGLEPAPPQARKDSSATWSFTLRAARPTALSLAKESP